MTCSNHDCLMRVTTEDHHGIGTNATCKCIQEAIRKGAWINIEQAVRQWRSLAMHYEAEWGRCSERFNQVVSEKDAEIEQLKQKLRDRIDCACSFENAPGIGMYYENVLKDIKRILSETE